MRTRRLSPFTWIVLVIVALPVMVAPGCRSSARGVAHGIVDGLLHGDDEDDDCR
jgi:hypothetical protein